MRLELTNAERLLFINQYKILSLLEPHLASNYERLVTALEANYIEEYSSSMTFALRATAEADRKFVMKVLKMFLDFAEAREDGKIPASDLSAMPKYLGFDESELGLYADYLLGQEGHYRALKPVPDNSHFPMRDQYEKYLTIWSKIHTVPGVYPEHIQALLEELASK